MKILYVITKSNWGGAQRHVFDLATSMKERGHDVAVALGGDGILRKRLEDRGIFTHSIAGLERDISPSRDAGSFKEIFSIIRHRKPDVLHLHSPKAAGLGALAGRLLRVPKIIYTVHGWAFNEERPFHQRALIAFASWITMILTHTTVLISERELRQTLYFPGTKDKLQLVTLGIQSPIFMSIDGAKQTVAKMLAISLPEFSKRFAFCTIAELHPNKGLIHLLHSMESIIQDHPNALCVIMGDGQDKAMLNMLIKEKKLEQHVYLTGYVDNASELLKAFSLFILPSIKEALGYVILEAGAASLPVVATTVGGIPDVIEDMRSGVLVQPKNIRELAHAISFMIEHPDERKKYGVALKECVTTKFSLEKMVNGVEAIYK
ncbi:MAG: glycosyltransferase [Candidatus Pacebacteria bacterium]|nr:glycosyltransferase [Candidatus Paceibacterota bacterium]